MARGHARWGGGFIELSKIIILTAFEFRRNFHFSCTLKGSSHTPPCRPIKSIIFSAEHFGLYAI